MREVVPDQISRGLSALHPQPANSIGNPITSRIQFRGRDFGRCFSGLHHQFFELIA